MKRSVVLLLLLVTFLQTAFVRPASAVAALTAESDSWQIDVSDPLRTAPSIPLALPAPILLVTPEITWSMLLECPETHRTAHVYALPITRSPPTHA